MQRTCILPFRRIAFCLLAAASLLAASLVCAPTRARADIFRWDNGQVIPGTEGITPGPGVQLDHRSLAFARLHGFDLTGANFAHSDLSDAAIATIVTNANFTGAVVNGAGFLTEYGFTKEQLYSTASYQARDLRRIALQENNLSGWDFSMQDLSQASLWSATLRGANLTGAVITGATLSNTTRLGFTKEQLYSTASYQAHDLSRVALARNDMAGWDFSGQNLMNSYLDSTSFAEAKLSGANLTNAWIGSSFLNGADLTGANLENAYLRDTWLSRANFSGAIVNGTYLYASTVYHGFTAEQLYSTASYQSKNLQRILLPVNDLKGWDFSGQNLSNADLALSDITGANFTAANLRNANVGGIIKDALFTGAVVTGATLGGLTKEQLYSTASYQSADLSGIRLAGNLQEWDLSGQDLNGANFQDTMLEGATLSGANLTNSILLRTKLGNANMTSADLRGAMFSNLQGALTSNAILIDGSIDGLSLAPGETIVIRDYDGDQTRQSSGIGPNIEPIPINIRDAMVNRDGALIRLVLEADPWNSTISFQPGIPVELGGELELAFANGVDATASIGRTFKLFDWTGVDPSGRFDVVSDYQWDTNNLYTSGEVTLIPEPATWALAACAIFWLVILWSRSRVVGRMSAGLR